MSGVQIHLVVQITWWTDRRTLDNDYIECCCCHCCCRVVADVVGSISTRIWLLKRVSCSQHKYGNKERTNSPM